MITVHNSITVVNDTADTYNALFSTQFQKNVQNDTPNLLCGTDNRL